MQHLAPFVRRFGSGLILALVVALAAGDVVSAKGPDFYGPLRIRLVGSDGTRTFDASANGEGEPAYQLTQQVVQAVAAPSAGPAPEDAGAFYEVVFEQPRDAIVRFPWYGMPVARFFYHPGRGTGAPHLRVVVARESQQAHETWEQVAPGTSDLLARHATGLAPIQGTRAGATTAQATPSWLLSMVLFLIGAGLLFAMARRRRRATAG
jgi:hypothetical protein